MSSQIILLIPTPAKASHHHHHHHHHHHLHPTKASLFQTSNNIVVKNIFVSQASKKCCLKPLLKKIAPQKCSTI